MYQILLTITMAHLEYFSQKVAGIGCLHRRPVCVLSKIVVLTGYVSSSEHCTAEHAQGPNFPGLRACPPKGYSHYARIKTAAAVVAVRCEIWLPPKTDQCTVSARAYLA